MSTLAPERARPGADAAQGEHLTPLLTEAAFHEAIDVHGPAVFRYACAHVGPEHADDVMAETFAAAWRSREKFVDDSDNGLEAWLIGIARVIVAAHRRKEQRWLRMCADALRQRADASSAADETDTVERVDALELARTANVAELVASMPAREREPLLLHVLDGRTYAEIADMLGIPMGTVQSRISRGRSRLAKALRAAEGRQR